MSIVTWDEELGELLDDLGDALDVPTSKYEDAKQRYKSVGDWLNAEDSPIARFRPEIYPQGSFALGTVVRPLGEDDYDIDAVCLLHVIKSTVDQPTLKAMVGDRLKSHATYARMLLPEGRRCWTLKYADESRFHMDVLPSIPDEYEWLVAAGVPVDRAKHAICLTDRDTVPNGDWPRSNPRGYLEWFKSRMLVVFEERRKAVAMMKRADVQQVPDYEVRTPLQRAVQLLKRHRDLMFNGDEDKPISIIITTLAARAYENEANLLTALTNMVPRMRALAEVQQYGTYWIPNPVNPAENFADKWAARPRKAERFFQWVTALEDLHKRLIQSKSVDAAGRLLEEAYGEGEAREAMVKYAKAHGRTAPVLAETSLATAPSRQSAFDVPHRQQPLWPVALSHRVNVAATASRPGFRTVQFDRRSPSLAKQMSLRFEASTNVPPPFDVYWQVVNTGAEAEALGQQRGRIFGGKMVQTETTSYRGMHWVECFIVKAGVCVARSGEVVVNIS